MAPTPLWYQCFLRDVSATSVPGHWRSKSILNIADVVFLYGVGETKEEAMKDHDRKLEAFLERCQAVGIKLNPKKMRLKLSPVRFMGHLVTGKGVLPKLDKVTAIRNIPAPTDLHGVHR